MVPTARMEQHSEKQFQSMWWENLDEY